MIDLHDGVPGVNAPDPTSYEEFWPFYLSQHLHPMTQRVHAGATFTAIAVGVSSLFRRKWKLFLASPLFAYGPAFTSHWIWEGNNPVVVAKGKPIWAARADLEMVSKVLTGRIRSDAEAVRRALGLEEGQVTLADRAKSEAGDTRELAPAAA